MVGLIKTFYLDANQYKGKFRNQGPGKPGLKSRALRRAKDAIEDAGFFFPTHVSFTPEFFKRILTLARVKGSKNAREARERLSQIPFCASELNEISNAINFFGAGHVTNYLIVRSDDHPLGLGLSYSGIVATESHRKKIVGIANQMKQVLASDYSPEMRVFERITGTEGNSGVILMPMYGDRQHRTLKEGENVNEILIPPISINVLGKVDGKMIVSMGLGLGGANDPRNSFQRVVTRISMEAFFGALQNAGQIGNYMGNVVLLDGAENKLVDKINLFSETDMMRGIGQSIGTPDFELNGMIECLFEGFGPGYFEIVKDEIQRNHWVVVQAAPFEFQQVKSPSFEGVVRKHESYNVVGTKSIENAKIRFATVNAKQEDVEFNQQNKEYILVIKASVANRFKQNWNLTHYSNAGAVVLIVDEMMHEYSSHLNGIFRALNIPVIGFVGEQGDEIIKDIIRNNSQDPRGTLHADEFKQEGAFGIKK